VSLIAREFELDCREKKRTGSGIFSRKGKRGYVGRMLFPSDIMSRKDKYNHRKAGKVIMTNMYDTIITYEKFKTLSDEEMKKHLIEYRNRFTMSEIISGMGIGKNTYARLIKDLPRAPRKESGKRKVRGGTTAKKKVQQLQEVVEVETPAEVIPQSQVVVLPKIDGMQFSYSGHFTPQQIIAKLNKLELLLGDEEHKFNIKLFIEETEEKVG
jgi:hypothetical protein